MSSVWPLCLERLQAELPPEAVFTLLKPLQVNEADGRLSLYAPNAYVVEHLREHLPRIRELASHFSEAPIEVRVSVGSLPRAAPAGNGAAAAAPVRTATSNEPALPALDSHHRFDNFVLGRSNELARAAAWEAAHRPGERARNPLLLYGSTGLGKTHLMVATGNRMRELNPGARVLYLHANQFVDAFTSALYGRSGGGMEAFKRQFRQLDALLIDDVQFFAGKDRTQEEFFHTFNAVIDGRQQIVLTCDRYPRELEGVEPRLKSRLGNGLAAGIDPPDFETRAEIVLSKASEHGAVVPEEVVLLIARNLRSNVRDLEGAVKTLAARAGLMRRPITVEFAKDTLRDALRAQQQAIGIEKIQKVVADYYQVPRAVMTSKSRARTAVRPRQVAMALAKELTDHSLPEIGGQFDRDHTTVMHARDQIDKLVKTDARMAEDWGKLIRKLTE
ncbi:MAG: chromosomal replication initiator protein DnaA [Proteobacteria bacterium]|nr:chromosomal replication initiator protein DnaA [Pseudomonadota bacterium]